MERLLRSIGIAVAGMSKRDALEFLEKLSAKLNTRMQALRSEIEQADV